MAQSHRTSSAHSLPTPEPLDDEATPEPGKRSPSVRPRISTPTKPKSAPAVPSASKSKVADKAVLRRPGMPPHAQSAPARHSNAMSSKTHQRIIHQLRAPLPPAQVKNQATGNNYIFETVVSSDKLVMKIGSTRGSEYARLDTISKACKHVHIAKQEDPEHAPIRLHARAEILMHAELKDLTHTFSCQCKVKAHREYFDVDKEVALEVVQRWRRFCQWEPYGEDGNLKPFWEQRLRNFSSFDSSETELDHKARGRRWDQFVNPSSHDMFLFDLRSALGRVWRRRWETIAFIQSFRVLILTFPQFSTVIHFMLISCGIMLELAEFDLPIFLSAFAGARTGVQQQASSKPQEDAASSPVVETPARESCSPEEEPDQAEISYIVIEDSDDSSGDESTPVQGDDDTGEIPFEDTGSDTSEQTSLASEE